MLNPNKKYTVYRHVSPNGKQYVGITSKKNVNDRWQGGKGYYCNQYFTNAIKKYGWQNFKHEILATGLSMDEATEMEKRLIREGNLTDRQYGYNCSTGGECGFLGVHGAWSDERKREHGQRVAEYWSDYVATKQSLITRLRNKGIVIPRYLENTSLDDDWLDYDPLNPDYCGEALCKRVLAGKAERFFRKNYKHIPDELPIIPCYGLNEDLDTMLLNPEEYDDQLFDSCEKIAVMKRKEGCEISHFDYVLCPDGKKRKIYSREDIEQVLADWSDYCEQNWTNGQNQVFDPEHKIKFMLDGLANILLRNHSDGVLTEYQKMKIGRYEIPLSACASLFGDEVYSERPVNDNGEGVSKMARILEEAAQKFEDAKVAKNSKKRREELANKKPKQFPPTRRQKLLAAEKQFGFKSAHWVRVDTENVFHFGGNYYQIPADCAAYAPRVLKDGDLLYDMDQILCAETADGVIFFDMNIEPVDGVKLIGEQLKFC